MSKLENRRWLTPREVSRLLSVSMSTLRRWRYGGEGPEWRKLSYRTVRYNIASVQAFADKGTPRA